MGGAKGMTAVADHEVAHIVAQIHRNHIAVLERKDPVGHQEKKSVTSSSPLPLQHT
jgi:hypothetical protein